MNSLAQASPAALQADALVGEIERLADERIRAVDAAAARDVAEILGRARTKARRQQRRALAEMRLRQRERLLHERASLETQARGREAAGARTLLASAWPMLVDAVAGRWLEAGMRRAWIAAAVGHAAASLRSRDWQVRHGRVWSGDDQAALADALRAHGVDEAAIVVDDMLEAGVVIEADQARVDATPAALLADRAAIEAELLAAVAGQIAAGGIR